MSEALDADVVIIGSGVAGALIADGLAGAGVRVVILEAGPKVDRVAAVERTRLAPIQTPDCAYETTDYAQRPVLTDLKSYYVQQGPDDFSSSYERAVGGSTWHWLGTSLRLLPNDFRTRSTYGVGADWPISYDEIETWYGRAERELGVAGDDDAPLGVKRSTKYPMPPIPQTYLDTELAAAVQGKGITVVPTPQARNSELYQGRPACCGNANCIPVCPIGAKYDATVHVNRAVKAGARLITPAVVTKLETDSEGRITAALYRDPVNEQRITAKLFVLAAHAVESPRLLLLSASERYPSGLANSSDQVGRNLMDHPSLLSYAIASKPIYPLRSPLATSGVEQFRDTPERRTRGGFRVEIGNDAWTWPLAWPPQYASTLVAEGFRGPALRAKVSEMVSRQFRLASLVEQLPDPANRVTLDPSLKDGLGLPRPRINYRVDDYTKQGRLAALDVHQRIFDAFGATSITHEDGFQGAGHILGTTRMGTDPRSSVVDRELRSHDHPNLFVMGSGTFPTAGASNPTLTIAALSLRAVPEIRRQLSQSV